MRTKPRGRYERLRLEEGRIVSHGSSANLRWLEGTMAQQQNEVILK